MSAVTCSDPLPMSRPRVPGSLIPPLAGVTANSRYERLRIVMAALAETRGSPISVFEFFVMGAIAKAAATSVFLSLWCGADSDPAIHTCCYRLFRNNRYATYPLQIAQTRLRSQKKNTAEGKPPKYHGTLDCLVKIVNEDGVGGLYQGINAKLLQTVLTAAFQFLTWVLGSDRRLP